MSERTHIFLEGMSVGLLIGCVMMLVAWAMIISTT